MLSPDVSIKLRVGLTVLLVALVPVLVLSAVAVGSLSAALKAAQERELSAQREAILSQFETRIQLVSRILGAEEAPRGRPGAEADLAQTAKKYWSDPPLLEALYLFGPDFEFWAGRKAETAVPETGVPSDLRLKLQSTLFSRPQMVKDIGLESAEARVVLLRKTGAAASTRYWAAVLSPELWIPTPTLSGGLQVSLLNSHYQVLHDSRKEIRPSSVQIHPLSQRLLQGFSEVRTWDNQVWATGSLDLKDTAVFLALSPVKDPVTGPVTRLLVTFAFLVLLTTLLAAVAAFLLSRSVIRFGEQVLSRRHFSKQMTFFVRLEKTLSDVAGRAGDLSRLASDLNYLRNDLSVIREMMPEDGEEDPPRP